MRILVTGRHGQVASALAEQATDHELVFAARPDLDLAHPDSIERAIAGAMPDLIFSVAAYTAVDKAEEEPELAMAINGIAPGVIGRAAAAIGAPVLHLSTDYVFDGSLDRPWREEDPVAPLGVYGATKLAGERALTGSGARHAILRTAWVYSPFGSNFVKTMLRLAQTRDEISVVADQFGCPTSAGDIATALIGIADRWAIDRALPGADRVYHFAGTGDTHWAGFAEAIFASSGGHGGPTARVVPIASSAYPTKARRPANSRLDSGAFAATFGYRAAAWRTSLDEVVRRVLAA